jgi:hypothetical protein
MVGTCNTKQLDWTSVVAQASLSHFQLFLSIRQHMQRKEVMGVSNKYHLRTLAIVIFGCLNK